LQGVLGVGRWVPRPPCLGLLFAWFHAIMGLSVFPPGLALCCPFLPAPLRFCPLLPPPLPWVFPVPAPFPVLLLLLSVPFLPPSYLRPAFLWVVRLVPMPWHGGCFLRPRFSPLPLVSGGLAVLPLPVGRWRWFLPLFPLVARPVCGVSSLRPSALPGCCLRPGLPVAFAGWVLGLGPRPPWPLALVCPCWPSCRPVFLPPLAGVLSPLGVVGGWPALPLSSCLFLPSVQPLPLGGG
jgi:hypothetical protein